LFYTILQRRKHRCCSIIIRVSGVRVPPPASKKPPANMMFGRRVRALVVVAASARLRSW
jgi:hypothetical protein